MRLTLLAFALWACAEHPTPRSVQAPPSEVPDPPSGASGSNASCVATAKGVCFATAEEACAALSCPTECQFAYSLPMQAMCPR